MSNTRSMSPENRLKLADSKMNWQRGGQKVEVADLERMEFRPYVPKPLPHGAGERMAAYRAIRSLYT